MNTPVWLLVGLLKNKNMLLNFNDLFAKYGMKVKGVIQVGAHKAQEHKDYTNHGVSKVIYIEPGPSFAELVTKFHGNEDVILFNTACGDGSEGPEKMAYVEHTNQGMSSSLLPPKVHLTQHPDVIFDSRELWKVAKLDDLPFDRSQYNLLNMDCQGYEGSVLKGGSETLKHIDYVYTECNRLEMYEGNMLVEELDKLLSDFYRVETGWASDYHGWGDAFYIRKSLLKVAGEYKLPNPVNDNFGNTKGG
jgi:FkbM family methyltransferase